MKGERINSSAVLITCLNQQKSREYLAVNIRKGNVYILPHPSVISLIFFYMKYWQSRGNVIVQISRHIKSVYKTNVKRQSTYRFSSIWRHFYFVFFSNLNPFSPKCWPDLLITCQTEILADCLIHTQNMLLEATPKIKTETYFTKTTFNT